MALVGFNPGQLIGRTGKSLSFTMNGEKKTVRGEYGKAAEISVNQKPASLETLLKNGDSVTVVAACNGKDAQVKAADIGRVNTGKVSLNGKIIDISTGIIINGKNVSPENYIKEGDIVEYMRPGC